jgi:hypothetical protein
MIFILMFQVIERRAKGGSRPPLLAQRRKVSDGT